MYADRKESVLHVSSHILIPNNVCWKYITNIQENIDAKHQYAGKLIFPIDRRIVKNITIYERLSLYKLSQYSTIKNIIDVIRAM